MKTVIIPNDYHPFVIEVNGVKYTYPEGTEQSVPDEVASAIENIYKLAPREGDPNPVPFGVDADGKEEYKSKYTGREIDAAVAKAGNLPATTSADAGKALVVDEEGKIVAGQALGGVIDGDYKPTGANYSFSEILPRVVAAIIQAGEPSGYMPVDAQYYGSELNNYIINEVKAGKTHIAGTATGTLPSGTLTIPYDCLIKYKSISNEYTLVSFDAYVNVVVYQFSIAFGISAGNSISLGCFYQFRTVG